jgi:hypothetical protein
MAEPIWQHAPAIPRDRLKSENGILAGYFYPGEVAELLAIRQIDYHQLRRFYLLIRKQAGHAATSGWSRFTFTDLACLLVALNLSGGAAALQPGRRLVLSNLDKACQSLREQGLTNPLLTVRLIRRGRSVFAEIDGVFINPSSGQQIFNQASQAIEDYFDRHLVKDKKIARAIDDEIRRHRRISIFDQNGNIRTARTNPQKSTQKPDESSGQIDEAS